MRFPGVVSEAKETGLIGRAVATGTASQAMAGPLLAAFALSSDILSVWGRVTVLAR